MSIRATMYFTPWIGQWIRMISAGRQPFLYYLIISQNPLFAETDFSNNNVRDWIRILR